VTPRALAKTFRTIGRDIFLRGLISSHSGNMSVLTDDRICITKRATMLGSLTAKDLVEVSLDGDDTGTLMASSELVVHRAIYRATDTLAIVHVHPPYATLLSMTRDELVPQDSEGSYLLQKVPVVSTGEMITIGSAEAAVLVSETLKDYRVVMLRGHGSFARGDTLEEAYMLTSSLEASSFFLYHLTGTRREFKTHAEKYNRR
jgi:L-fuculose-phosphate aldolase